ncbi:hypothetical protein [Nonomuraea diastatica]|uniref:Uncharacterized protein n=1 Tax=Nonomuraea diastatica TaxID=1848329 RepID=A0A4R4WYS4_9ACTN|nr:hypothetical protein [Nonomuraea diastatica]TDD22961.1 hypothetical protein E1294_10040 [Nonomuraea diastatica]
MLHSVPLEAGQCQPVGVVDVHWSSIRCMRQQVVPVDGPASCTAEQFLRLAVEFRQRQRAVAQDVHHRAVRAVAQDVHHRAVLSHKPGCEGRVLAGLWSISTILTRKSLEAKEPFAAITGLTNDIRVRAKTAFGVSDWEAATATKAVPPPPPPGSGSICVLESGTRAVASEPGRQQYIDRVRHYFRGQDTVLEGGAETIWDAPGVTPEGSNTAKLSILDATLVSQREAMERAETTRTESAVEIVDAVVQSRQAAFPP